MRRILPVMFLAFCLVAFGCRAEVAKDAKDDVLSVEGLPSGFFNLSLLDEDKPSKGAKWYTFELEIDGKRNKFIIASYYNHHSSRRCFKNETVAVLP